MNSINNNGSNTIAAKQEGGGRGYQERKSVREQERERESHFVNKHKAAAAQVTARGAKGCLAC